MTITRETIRDTLSKSKNLSPEEMKMQEDALVKIFEEGLMPGEALGFSQNFLDRVYKFAYSLYQRRKIEEATELFKWLKSMDPNEEKYVIALMHCFMLQKKWIGAVTMQVELAYRHPENPYPYVTMCECLLEANDISGAMVAIRSAIIRAGDKPEYAKDKEKWQMTYEFILAQLNVDPEVAKKIGEEEESKEKAEK